MWCTSYSKKYFEERYWILIQPQIDNQIQPKGFEVSNLQIHINYHAIMKLLTGESVYGEKRYGLRELIQNSLDACRLMEEEAKQMERYKYVSYIPNIQVILDYKIGKMIVLDNGTGMNNEILEKYFLNIGQSYYKSNEFLYQGKNYKPIGTFGIGFLACFMLSDNVIVETKYYMDKEGFSLELEADSEFLCKKMYSNLIGDSGTSSYIRFNKSTAGV